jgi:hypothetical protein
VRFGEFKRACPELAGLAEDRLRRAEVLLLGTLRRNGWPRITPVECDFVGDDLMIGMMWRSPKALDLMRDPRCVVHSVVTDRQGTEGDAKLYGTAVAVDEPERRAAYCEAIMARIGWAPEEPDYHLFAIDVTSAGFVIFGDERYALAWDPERGLRRMAQREA